MEFGKYHFRYYMSSTLIVLVSLLAIIWLNQTLRLLELVVSRGGSLIDFALLSILPLPLWLMLALPMAVFSSVIWVLQKLSSDREMVVMQAIGMSKPQLAFPAIIFGTVTSLFLILNSFYLLPWSFSGFKELQTEIRTSIPKVLIKDGEFIDLDAGLTIFIGEKRGPAEIGNVFIQDNRQPNKFVTFTARAGSFGTENGRAVLELKNGQRTELSENGDASALLSFQSHMLDISRSTGQTTERLLLDTNEDTVWNLLNPGPDIPERYRNDRIAEGHFRLVIPLLPLTLTMVAVLGLGQANAGRQRRTAGIFTTACIGLLIVIAAVLARSSIAEETRSWPILYMIILGPILFGIGYLYRPKYKSELFESK